MQNCFDGRLGLIQRVLPSYRAPFFDALAASCVGGMSLFAGQPLPRESIATVSALGRAHFSQAHNLHFLNPQSRLYFCYQQGLSHWLETQNPNALIVEANFRYLSSPAALRWMRQRQRPVIGWGLGAPLDRGPLSALRARFLGQFDAMIAYSARGAEQYAACGCPVDRIFVAPNAVAPAPTQALPQRADFFSPQPVVLFVGRLQARKRIPSLLVACAKIPAPLQPRLVIVGDGPELDNLRMLAQSLYPAAEFVGAKHGAELAPYFRAADIFVMPGTGGLAVQEAMSYGLPVIVAKGDGTQDDLVRAENGWQIPPDDEAALFSTLREALSDAARLREMGAASYRIVAHEINLESMVGVFVEALNSVKP
ncbi:MAG: glycosyltransferase family 4 protein [Chloroflexi bacterium]|nr:glycosyltransferase family 4 protein [Chloroflexota bacterium]